MTEKPKIPNAPHRTQWLISVGLLVFLILGSEAYWRMQGHMPRVVDSDMLWGIHRNRVYGDSTIVMVGDSRIKSGVDPDIMRHAFPGYKIVQLAIAGQPAYYTLQDMANDPDFTGIILYGVSARDFKNHFYRTNQKPQVDYYRREFFKLRNMQERINTHIRVFLQNYLAILSPELILMNVLQKDLQPDPGYYPMNADRYRANYYSKMSPELLKRVRDRRLARLTRRPKRASKTTTRTFQDNVRNDLTHLYQHLRQRSGQLILIRMPASGRDWNHSEISYPKKAFWDKIPPWTGIPAIHFKDYLELSEFKCPDDTHLDAADVPEFTRALSRIIRDKLISPDSMWYPERSRSLRR